MDREVTPRQLGLPEKFDRWHDHQEEALDFAVRSTRRFPTMCAPTGFGKTVTYIGAAIKLRGRACILTSSKALQDQLAREFASVGLVDIRGRTNYPCKLRRGLTCEEGSVSNCPHKGKPECDYSRATMEATCAQLVVSNYAAWTAANYYGRGWGQFDLLILDEAHDAPGHLANAMRTVFTDKECHSLLPPPRNGAEQPMDVWKKWAVAAVPIANTLLQEAKAGLYGDVVPVARLRAYNHAKNLWMRTMTIAYCNPADWIADSAPMGYVFDPINPARYAERMLFLKVPKVLLVSATVQAKTLAQLGIERAMSEFKEYPSTFDLVRCPVYHVPTQKMCYSDSGPGPWITAIDQTMWGRRDRKGMIHTVSYRRAQTVLQNCRYADDMYYNVEGSSTSAAIESFLLSAPPTTLVSPSVTTGYDFPLTACEYQLVPKLPFPVNSKILTARTHLDRDYVFHLVTQILVQTCGRIMRLPEDRGETIILDDNIDWFIRHLVRLAPKWFTLRLDRLQVLPPAPPKL